MSKNTETKTESTQKRYEKLLERYSELHREGYKSHRIEEILADEFFYSPWTVRNIIYRISKKQDRK